MFKNKIACVVVWYNPVVGEIKNINSYIDGIDKLYIVDNSLDDKAKGYLPVNKKIEYIPNFENIGVAGALNIGADKAIKSGYKWLLTMDQDTNFKNDSFKKFIDSIPDINLDNIGIITPWHSTKLKDPKPKESIDYPLDVMTSGNLLNLDIYKKIGGFLDWIFIDGVDIDYCFRLRKNKYKIMRINTIDLLHNLGDIEYIKKFGRDILITNHNYMRRYYIARNYLYIKKEYSDIDPYTCDIIARQRRWIIKIVLFESDKYKKVKAIFVGKLDYYLGKKGKKNFKN